MNEACLSVQPNVNVETLIGHLTVNFISRIPLSKLDATCMSLKDLMHKFNKGYLLWLLSSIHSIQVSLLIMLISEMQINYGFFQKALSIFCPTSGCNLRYVVILNCLYDQSRKLIVLPA